MEKLNIAIIGQGRSGRNIHGAFYRGKDNDFINVKLVVELDKDRRERALKEYPGCEVMSDWKELIGRDDIQLVVNASYSNMHYDITKELLLAGFNVLVEKPFARTYFECSDLMKIAKEKNVTLAVFQQTFLAPEFLFSKEIADSGKIGEIKQVSIRYNSLARRWDWQTLQEKLGGSLYNTGPHPVGMALGFLDYSDDFRVEFARLATCLTSGDADDYDKLILSAPGKPVIDIEISSIDAYCDYVVKLQGTKGTYKATRAGYKMKYILDGENPKKPVIKEPLKNDEGLPAYCREELITHEEEGTFTGGVFDSAVRNFYEMLYNNIVYGTPLKVKTENIAKIIQVIETAHAINPLPKRF